MNDGKEMKGNRGFAIAIAVMMLMMVVQVPLSGTSDDSYAASEGSAPLGNLNVVVFDQDSADYSLLAYMSDELPKQLNAAEWVYDTDTRLWYNINSLSSDYGKTLRYGMISGMSVSEIRSDIIAFFTPLYIDSFTIVQVEYTVNAACNISIDVDKDGSSSQYNYTESMDRAGYRVVSSIQQLVPLSVSTSGADINVTDVRGDYTVEAFYDGISAGSKSVTYSGTSFALGGKAVDANNDPIRGVEVRYVIRSDDSPSASIVSSGSKITDSLGTFTIYAKRGEVAEITGVSGAGLTFPNQTYAYGTITGPSDGFTFKSKEHVVGVTVTDASDRVAANVPVVASWFSSEYSTSTGKYVISSSSAGIYCNNASVNVVTDSSGFAYITVDASQKPSADSKLYVHGGICNYTFTTDPNMNAGEHNSDLPVTPYGNGNVYVDTSVYADVSLRADDRSVEITVTGAKDQSLHGGAVLQDVQVEVGWYFQSPSAGGSGYAIRSADEPKESGTFHNLVAGDAWLPNMFTDVNGKLIVCYIEPTWSAGPNEYAYLYVRAIAGAQSSPSALYSFDSVEPSDGSKSIEQLDSDSDASVALIKGSVPAASQVNSDDVAYTITGTITGDCPEKVTVYCMYGTSGRFVDAVFDGVDINFSFIVMSGTSNTIEINSVDGYVFSPQRQTMATAYDDQTFTSVASPAVSNIDRDVPTSVSEYVVEGVAAGDIIDLRFSVGGKDCSVTAVATADPLVIDVRGWAGNVVSGIIVSGAGLYIDGFVYDSVNGYYVATASDIVDRRFVTFYDPVSNVPTIDNVVGMQTITILCDGALYTSVVSDQSGLINATVPDVATLTYRFGDLAVEASPVSGGAYDGYYAINLKDVIAPVGPKQITLTVRYIATSSLQNAELPTNVDILNGPMDITLDVGTTHSLVAPSVDGFHFSGWYINGESASDIRNEMACTFSVTEDLDGVVITASYSAVTPEPPKEDIGTIVAIGMVSVTIALIALIYVILQIRRN